MKWGQCVFPCWPGSLTENDGTVCHKCVRGRAVQARRGAQPSPMRRDRVWRLCLGHGSHTGPELSLSLEPAQEWRKKWMWFTGRERWYLESGPRLLEGPVGDASSKAPGTAGGPSEHRQSGVSRQHQVGSSVAGLMPLRVWVGTCLCAQTGPGEGLGTPDACLTHTRTGQSASDSMCS